MFPLTGSKTIFYFIFCIAWVKVKYHSEWTGINGDTLLQRFPERNDPSPHWLLHRTLICVTVWLFGSKRCPNLSVLHYQANNYVFSSEDFIIIIIFIWWLLLLWTQHHRDCLPMLPKARQNNMYANEFNLCPKNFL